MWLRDTLPEDLPGAQVWIYGYDSKLTASVSFQDLEALSSTFRRILVSSRRQYTVSFQGLGALARSEVCIAHRLTGIK